MKRYYIRASRWDPEPPTLAERPTGPLLKRDEVIDALAQLPHRDWPEEEVLAALGIEWHELAAVDGAREDV